MSGDDHNQAALSEDWLYEAIARTLVGNGTIHFDSDRMDDDEFWVRHIARNLARRIARGEVSS